MFRIVPFICSLFIFFCSISTGTIAADQDYTLAAPAVANRTIELKINPTLEYDSITLQSGANSVTVYSSDGANLIKGPIIQKSSETLSIKTYTGGVARLEELKPNIMPAWLSILPPLLAILFAIVFKEVISSLFIGILSGVFLHIHYMFPEKNLLSGFFLSITDYLIPSVADPDHISVIVFSLLIGGTVAVISRNGGMVGMVKHISRYAKTPRSAQMVSWVLGVVIFFDDYANTLVVGNTMRPVTDKLKVSREKLAYIVDATAAPVASVAFVTTWIGAQLGYIQDGIDTIDGLNASPYHVFIESLKYAFYPFFTLVFMWLLIRSKKDFGPMLKAERKSRKADHINQKVVHNEEIEALDPEEHAPKRAFNAVIPILVLIFGTMTSLWITGFSESIWTDPEMGFWSKVSGIIGNADSYKSLLWSSTAALSVSILLSVSQRILKLHDTMTTVLKGFGFMLNAIIILCLAWTLSLITDHLETAQFITSILQTLDANPVWFPAITFVLASLVSFSTGSSWSTMAILYPMLLPAMWLLCMDQGLEHQVTLNLFFNVVSCVLAGSVLGDHCSPISDTTILSSLSTSCNHLSHVRTQMPYALTVGGISLVLGTIPAAFGISTWLLYPFGFLAIYLIIRIFGKLSE
ncbi:MAG: Na+/H+ antiporter NhaC family protein [Bacteroidia bacterium]